MEEVKEGEGEGRQDGGQLGRQEIRVEESSLLVHHPLLQLLVYSDTHTHTHTHTLLEHPFELYMACVQCLSSEHTLFIQSVHQLLYTLYIHPSRCVCVCVMCITGGGGGGVGSVMVTSVMGEPRGGRSLSPASSVTATTSSPSPRNKHRKSQAKTKKKDGKYNIIEQYMKRHIYTLCIY